MCCCSLLVLQGSAAFKCTSALGSQLRSKSIAEFDRDKQVYQKHELSPLPFQPPPFYTYATSMLSGTFKVGSPCAVYIMCQFIRPKPSVAPRHIFQ